MAAFIEWEKFITLLVSRVGKQRSQMIFCEQTGYTRTCLSYWKRTDSVPVEAYERIESIDLSACDTERFKGYHTVRFYQRVVELSNQRVSIKRMAEILTVEMGRKITENSVKSARLREKDKIVYYKARAG